MPLSDGYTADRSAWEQEARDLDARTGDVWSGQVAWYLRGVDDCRCHPGARNVTHPFRVAGPGGVEQPVTVLDEDHLAALVAADHAAAEPAPGRYLPTFRDPVENLGWCLYETVTEGTPLTGVLETSDALVDYLVDVGEDRGHPMPREEAEELVRAGGASGILWVRHRDRSWERLLAGARS